MGKRSKKQLAKIGAPILAAILIVSTVFYYVPKDTAYAETESEKTLNEQYPDLLSEAEGGEKSETVYAVLDANGEVDEVTISEWLKNTENAKNVKDYSVLKDIKNTSSNIEFDQDGKKLTWKDTNGEDIHYSGTYDDSLPVHVRVTYYLDGEPTSPKNIAGKEGDIEIHFDYSVNDSVSVDGYNMTTPYAIISAVVLDNDTFTNIEVNNGKAIDSGDSTAVVGVALPGMSENLGISSEDIDIPDQIVIKAHTTDFSIDGTYTVASSGFLSDADTSGLDDASDKVTELESALNQLSKASKQLVEGSEDLAEGAGTLSEGTDGLAEGADGLKDATSQLSSGANELASGTDNLSQGVKSAKSGAKDVSDGAATLYSGMQDVAEGVSELNNGVNKGDTENGTPSLVDAASQLASGASDVNDGVQALVQQVNASATSMASLKQGLKSVSSTLDGVSAEGSMPSDAELQAAINAALEAEKAAAEARGESLDDDDTYKAIQAIASELGTYETEVGELYKDDVTKAKTIQGVMDNVDSIVDQIPETTAEQAAQIQALAQGAAQLATGAGQVNDGVKELSSGVSQLDAGVNGYTDADGNFHPGLALGMGSLNSGLNQLNSGLNQIDDGATALNSGAQSLKTGAGQLDAGAGQLVEGVGALADGAEALADGANQLAEGMATFNKSGIQKMVGTLNDADIDGMLNRANATMDAAKTGSFVGGKLDSTTGESKIIFKTAEIKKSK